MKIIKIEGGKQTGKTDSALGLLNYLAVWYHDTCLAVFPTIEEARNAEAHGRKFWCRTSMLQIKFIGCEQFNSTVRGDSNIGVIAFCDISRFKRNSEGSYVQLAKQRLKHKPQSTIIIDDDYWSENDYRWVWQSVWYKPWTWGRGYWKKRYIP